MMVTRRGIGGGEGRERKQRTCGNREWANLSPGEISSWLLHMRCMPPGYPSCLPIISSHWLTLKSPPTHSVCYDDWIESLLLNMNLSMCFFSPKYDTLAISFWIHLLSKHHGQFYLLEDLVIQICPISHEKADSDTSYSAQLRNTALFPTASYPPQPSSPWTHLIIIMFQSQMLTTLTGSSSLLRMWMVDRMLM